MNLPEHLQKTINHLRELPSLGPRQATRLAFFLTGSGRALAQELASDLQHLANTKLCERCFFIHDEPNGSFCSICSNQARISDVIMIVEKETDLLSVEETGKFQGIYCVLGHIPKTGNLKDWQKLRLSVLKKYIQETLGGVAQEIILGFNPSSAGDFHTQLIQKELQGYAKKISRLGRGLPTGAEIEFADSDTLGASLDGRK